MDGRCGERVVFDFLSSQVYGCWLSVRGSPDWGRGNNVVSGPVVPTDCVPADDGTAVIGAVGEERAWHLSREFGARDNAERWWWWW